MIDSGGTRRVKYVKAPRVRSRLQERRGSFQREFLEGAGDLGPRSVEKSRNKLPPTPDVPVPGKPKAAADAPQVKAAGDSVRSESPAILLGKLGHTGRLSHSPTRPHLRTPFRHLKIHRIALVPWSINARSPSRPSLSRACPSAGARAWINVWRG